MHNFTVSAQDIFTFPSTFGIYREFYRNFASTTADNETFCIVLLTSQVVMIQRYNQKVVSSSPRVFFFLPLFDSFNFHLL